MVSAGQNTAGVKEGVNMSMESRRFSTEFSSFEQLRYGREVLRVEGQAILTLANRLQDEFSESVSLLSQCRGNVIVTGMGKAGLVGRKIAATLASTGTSSHFLHPGEAVHGDLGRIHPLDAVLALSYSGETAEVTRLLSSLAERETVVVAITRSAQSTLGRSARVTLELGTLREACALGLAPSTSTTAMLALGDALALVLSRLKGFEPEDFARFHPGGSLGCKLSRAEEVMRPLKDCRVAQQTETVRDVLIQVSRPGRRTGAIMLVDADGRLTGLFTDSDLARILEHGQETALDAPISQVMTRSPTTVPPGIFRAEVTGLMAERKISELPVVDSEERPLGLIDITDLLMPDGNLPEDVSLDKTSSTAHAEGWRAMTFQFPTP